MPSFTPGNTIRIPASFQNAGTYYDPGSVSINVIDPMGQTPTSLTVVKDAVGLYHADVVCTNAGVWQYQIQGSTPASAFEGSFTINPSAFTA